MLGFLVLFILGWIFLPAKLFWGLVLICFVGLVIAPLQLLMKFFK